MNLTPEIELSIREYLKAKVETVPEIGKVFTRGRTYSSEQDFIDETKFEILDDIEVRFCEISLLSFRDSPTDGCDDEPVVFLTYNFHIEFEFKDKRENDTNSFDDFVKAVLDLRNVFLENRSWNNEDLEHSPLTQPNPIITEDAVVHKIDLQTVVTVL